MYVDNTLNNQYAIPPVNASKPLKKDTFSSSANTMPITNRAVQEPNVLNKTMPNDYLDCEVPRRKPLDTEIYFNDKKDDPLDLGITCFPDEFNKGMVNC